MVKWLAGLAMAGAMMGQGMPTAAFANVLVQDAQHAITFKTGDIADLYDAHGMWVCTKWVIPAMQARALRAIDHMTCGVADRAPSTPLEQIYQHHEGASLLIFVHDASWPASRQAIYNAFEAINAQYGLSATVVGMESNTVLL
jgi:hypothetical protein